MHESVIALKSREDEAECSPASCYSDGLEPESIDELAHPPAPGVPERKTVYVTVQGAEVTVKQGQLLVKKGETKLLEAPVTHVGQIVCLGSIGISAGVRDAALRNGIEVILCSRAGIYRGRLEGVSSYRPSIRRAHYRVTESLSETLPIARALVLGKIANQAALLIRYGRRVDDARILRSIRHLRTARERVESTGSLSQLMGLEGAAAKSYFSAWPALLPEGISFGGRSHHPPKDAVNAALSFGYSLLTGNVVAAIVANGLDPALSVLHAEQDGRPSLALDLMEEFRPLIVDSVVLETFRRRILDDSAARPSDRGDGTWLEPRGRHRLIQRFEERLLTHFSHVRSGRRVSYRQGLYLQARLMVDVVHGIKKYEAVGWR